jgi:hypothetical protein
MTVQSQIDDVEWASINISIIKAIESGTRELNRIHEERSLEDVEMLMDETNEAIEVAISCKCTPTFSFSFSFMKQQKHHFAQYLTNE